MERVEDFNEKLKILPHKSGCYLYYDIEGTVIYVGKAKDLYKRVNSYFNRVNNLKTTLLVEEIYDFKYIITNNEAESLILELNLIKENFPKYNIKLMDDSTYPYIEITDGLHPRLIYTRKPKSKKKKNIFGPYPNSRDCAMVVGILNRIYPLRKCKKIPDKSCIYYQMNNCLAPCIKNVSTDDYESVVEEIKNFLKGNIKSTVDLLTEKMNTASENMDFEHALNYRDLIRSCKNLYAKQIIDTYDEVNRDILSYATYEDKLCINQTFMRSGKIIASENIVFELVDAYETFQTFVSQFYHVLNVYIPNEIILIEDIPGFSELVKTKVIVPKIGEKLRLIELSKNNAYNKLVELDLLEKRKESKTIGAMEELNRVIGTTNLRTIEMFDNSSLAGTNPVSAMVRFIDGKKDTKGYRKYNIKTVKGLDDYATMKEVVYRRYFRLLTEDKEMPDILIVDGGKGQLSIAKEVLSMLNITSIKVIGLKKNNKHKTEAIINTDFSEISLEKSSDLYRMLDMMQEEVHRFAITFHKSKRRDNITKSVLDDIAGVGQKRKMLLLKDFGSIDKIIEASIEEFKKIGIPENVAKKIKEQLKD